MGKSRATILMASLVGGLLAAAAVRAEPIKPESEEITPPTEEILFDPPWNGELPPDLPPDSETWVEPGEGEGIIDLEGGTVEMPPEGCDGEVIYYLMDSPPQSGEPPLEGEYLPLSAQSGLYHNPEPGSLVLGGLGLLGLLGYGWRRRA